MREGQENKQADSNLEAPSTESDHASNDPRNPRSVSVMRNQRRIRSASAYNAAHPDLIEQFNRLTGGIGAGGPKAIMSWQKAHGLTPADGKIGPATLQAAQSKSGGDSDKRNEAKAPRSEVAAGEDAPADHASPSHAVASPPAEKEEGGLAAELVGSGVTDAEETREKEDPEEMKREGGNSISEASEVAGEAVGAEEKLEHVKGGNAGLKLATQIARLPHVIHLVKAGKYEEAVNYIRDGLGFSDYIEVIKLVAEHCGIELAEIATKAPWLLKIGKAAAIGAETVDVVMVGIQFQFEALKALQKAHEEGERDNRIFLYSTAWAHSFLWGSYSNAGAIEEKQLEAVANGVRDGKATAGNCGEKAEQIGKQLLKEYGDPQNAEHALVDALLKRAGVEGIKLHEGK